MESSAAIEIGECAMSELKCSLKTVVDNSVPTSEGYCTLLCGTVIAHIVNELNKSESDKVYDLKYFL